MNETASPLRKTSQSKSSSGITVVIMTLFFLSPTISAISPAMSLLASDYPSVSPAAIGYVMTVTAAAQAVTAVVAGSIVGKRVRYKTMLIIASLLYTIAGCFPFFLSSGTGFELLLASRVLLGVGLGIIMPLSNAMVLAFFADGDERAKLIGRGNVMLNVGTIATNLVGGFLCAISWQTTFLIYATGIVLLLFSAILMKEPAAAPAHNDDAGAFEASADRAGARAKLPLIAFAFIIIFLLNVILVQPAIVYNAQLLAGADLTSPVLAAIMIALFSVGGAIMSAIFPKAFQMLKAALLPLAFFVTALGLLLLYVGSLPEVASPIVYGVGIALLGVGLLATTCFTPLALSQTVAPDMQSTAMGFVSFAMAAGTFLSTPFAQAVAAITGNDAIGTVLIAALVCSIVIGVVLSCFSRKIGRTYFQ